MSADVGVVAIGRNEGDRLVRCLASARGEAAAVVYVDSCSTDGSAERARALGVDVVELDRSRPLNAARGRNAGLAWLTAARPELRYVFFVDGDCEIVPGWLASARAELEADEDLGAVCGRRVELHPEASVYNRLVDTEWDTPVGPARACGGDVLARVRAIAQIGGYDESMSCGEDPEMSFRLRAAGWRILRIPGDMTRHDVALTRFSSWWRRHARGGYAYAHGALKHLHGPEWFNLARTGGILFWGLGLPTAALVAAAYTAGLGGLLLLGYGGLFARVARWRRGLGDSPERARRYAAFVVLGKPAEALGVLRCLFERLFARQSTYVDYKEYTGSPARGSERARSGEVQ